MSNQEPYDIPEPDEAQPEPARRSTADVDPGGDDAALPADDPDFGDDPAYDAGGLGRQPDVAEQAEEYGGP